MYQNYVKKWVRSRGNYAYTRFEEFRTCSGEVLFTNEHKAVFSKSEELKYIDINGFKIFKEYSKESETIFKIKLMTDIFIKKINAKKGKDVDNSYLKTIDKYVCKIKSYCLLCNTTPKLDENSIKIRTLFYMSQFNENNKIYILKKINDLVNNSLGTIWYMVYEKDERVATKVDFDMENINKLTRMVRENEIDQSRARKDIKSLMSDIKDKLMSVNEKLYREKKIGKKGLIKVEKGLQNHATTTGKRLR